MTAVKERKSTRRSAGRTALKPAFGFAALVIILLASFALSNRPDAPGKGLFTNPDDIEFDGMLVRALNEHELLNAFEVFNQPVIIAIEREVNDGLLVEMME
jgi:hypothetical protein